MLSLAARGTQHPPASSQKGFSKETFMLVALFLTSFMEPVQIRSIPIPDQIFRLRDLKALESDLVLLDGNEGALVRISEDGTVLHSHVAKGQGPGEFQLPRALAVTDQKILVSDFGKILVFSHELVYESELPLFNNPLDLEWHKDEIYMGLTKYPAEAEGIYVYNETGVFIRKFYRHQSTSELTMPFIEINPDKDMIYVLNRERYSVDIFTTDGKTNMDFKEHPSPLYLEMTEIDVFYKRHGQNLSAIKKWKTSWHEPAGLALQNGHLWVCFSILKDDLRTREFFVDIYRISDQQKVVSWRKFPGKPFAGNDQLVYFVEDPSNDFSDEDPMILAGYKIDQ